MQPHVDAVEAGPAVPENGDVLTADTVQDVLDQDQNALNSPPAGPVRQGLDVKRVATCKARAALLGATLTEIVNDAGQPELILSRWALTRAFSNLAELERILDRMGAPA